MERESFVFYKSFYEAIKELSNETQLKIIKTIFDFALEGIEPTGLEGIEKAVFLLIKPQLEANNQRYENGCKGGEFGYLGGRPKNKQKKPQRNPKGVINKNPKQTPNDNDNVNDNVNENENENENGNGAEKEKEGTTKTANDFSFNSPKGKTTKTANGKTANDIPKGFKELVDYLITNYDCPEDKAKLIANRVQSDKVDLSLAHCEEFSAMTEEQIIGYFEAMKKLKQLRGRSKMVTAANVFNRT